MTRPLERTELETARNIAPERVCENIIIALPMGRVDWGRAAWIDMKAFCREKPSPLPAKMVKPYTFQFVVSTSMVNRRPAPIVKIAEPRIIKGV